MWAVQQLITAHPQLIPVHLPLISALYGSLASRTPLPTGGLHSPATATSVRGRGMTAEGAGVTSGGRRVAVTTQYSCKLSYMAKKTRTLENLLNGELARLLSSFDVPAEPEFSESGKRMDVVADVEGLRVVLEAETGFHRKLQAIRDADARLKQGLTIVVFAVCYPEGASVESLRDANLTWTVRTRADAPADNWAEGSVGQLVQAVRQTPASLSGADKAAQILSDGLDAAVQRLSTPMRRALARAIDLPPTKKPTGPSDDRYFTAAKRGMLVVATAMLFHHRVEQHLPTMYPAGFDGEWPPANAAACMDSDAPLHAYREAWRGILAVDYRPVFETGRVALNALPSNPEVTGIVRSLAGVVAQVTELVAGLRHDLLGRIFHRVLDTARYDGSYYTSTAAAVLLATLALRQDDLDWSDPNAIGRLRICDPACGTGTLLMAAAERIRDLRHAAGPISDDDEEALALLFVEDVLYGYDCNITATHMAASTLGMLSPKTQFHRMNVYRTRLGVYGGVPYLGSLEFLEGQARLEAWPTTAQQVDDEEQRVESNPPPPMDLVIMNPPFTRDSLRHDQFSAADEQAIKNREKKMMAGQPYRAAARLHSSGGAFTVLGDKLVKQKGGVLALVLPTVVPTAPGNLGVRSYLASRFHVETIICSHDPERIFFSENTTIGETLIICRRWDSAEPKPPTRVVNLTRNPATPLEALDTAALIKQSTESDFSRTDAPFTVQQIPSKRIEGGEWFAVNFLSPYLVEAYRTLANTSRRLSDLADVGPAGQRIRDSYKRFTLPTQSGRRALWQHDTDMTQSMRAETDAFIEPIASKRRLADKYWKQRSRMLLPAHMRLNTSRVAAVILPGPAVGSLWVPCRPQNPAIAEALCLYLNSSVGLLALLGGRGNRIPSYPTFSIKAQRATPVPDFGALNASTVASMAATFAELKQETLQPFPSMNDDPVRKRIDDVVVEALGIDAEWVANIRRALSEEPSITNRRHGT